MSATLQPSWHVVDYLGDVDIRNESSSLIMVDRRGNYDPELWVLDPVMERVCSFSIDRCILVPKGVGAVSDNMYHPDYIAWFGSPSDLASVESFGGLLPGKMPEFLCGSNLRERAYAYQLLFEFYGAENFGGWDEPRPDWVKFTNRAERDLRRCAKWEDGWK